MTGIRVLLSRATLASGDGGVDVIPLLLAGGVPEAWRLVGLPGGPALRTHRVLSLAH